MNDESSRVSGEAVRLGQAARAARAILTCLLERAARALKYSRRLGPAVDASVSETSDSGRANLGTVWVRWTCQMCDEGDHIGESSGRGGCGKGSSTLTYRNRALAGVD